MITIMDAIQALKPGAECLVRGDTYSGIEWLDKSQTQPTEEEVDAKLLELKAEEPMRLLREERTRRLSESDWMANSDVTMSDEWKTYRQELRDLPKWHSGIGAPYPKLDLLGNLDHTTVYWPTEPS